MGSVQPPTVAVIAHPYLYTSLIVHALDAVGGYVVEAPDLLTEVWEPSGSYDVVITSLAVPRNVGRVVIELPHDFGEPVLVSIGDLQVPVDVDPEQPLEGVMALVGLLARAGDVDAAAQVLRQMAPAETAPGDWSPGD